MCFIIKENVIPSFDHEINARQIVTKLGRSGCVIYNHTPKILHFKWDSNQKICLTERFTKT